MGGVDGSSRAKASAGRMLMKSISDARFLRKLTALYSVLLGMLLGLIENESNSRLKLTLAGRSS